MPSPQVIPARAARSKEQRAYTLRDGYYLDFTQMARVTWVSSNHWQVRLASETKSEVTVNGQVK